MQQRSNQIYSDKKQCLEGHNQGWETQPALRLVYDGKAVLAEGSIWIVRRLGLAQGTVGMPHEHLL